MTSPREDHWTLRSLQDVQQFWERHRTVPSRIDGRKSHQEERFNLALYLLALAEHALLDYPLAVEQGKQHESPDFMVTWPSGEVTGLEMTRATEPWFERAMNESDKEIRLSGFGWSGDQAEKEWCTRFRAAIQKKVSKLSDLRPASRHDLLIYDEAPLPVVDRRTALSTMHPFVKRQQEENPKLGKTSFIVSLDVLYDVGGEVQSFRYIEPPNPGDAENMKTFFERSEYAGLVSADRVVREQVIKGIPIYSLLEKGRVVKQTADGRRFEVKFREDGEEVIVRELLPE